MAVSAHRRNGGDAGALDHREWVEHTRVFLQPIAAPSILGLFGFAGATFLVSTHMAGWYGTPQSGVYLFPFAAAFGGIAQFAAGMWAFRARDGVAAAMHGTWGSFWIAYGILQLLSATGTVPVAAGPITEIGYWFFALAVITALGAVAALGENLGITAVLGTLAAGAALAGVFNVAGGDGWETAAGWVLFASSVLATYVAGAMMIAGAWGRTVLPLGEYRKAANVPGGRAIRPLEYELGEPGVRQGQ